MPKDDPASMDCGGHSTSHGVRGALMCLFCRFDTIVKVFADGGYTGALLDWAQAMFGYDVEVVRRNEMHAF